MDTLCLGREMDNSHGPRLPGSQAAVGPTAAYDADTLDKTMDDLGDTTPPC